MAYQKVISTKEKIAFGGKGDSKKGGKKFKYKSFPFNELQALLLVTSILYTLSYVWQKLNLPD